jgi:hypothetical protein
MYTPSEQSPSGSSGYTFAASVADALLYQFKEYARVAVVSIGIYVLFSLDFIFDFLM